MRIEEYEKIRRVFTMLPMNDAPPMQKLLRDNEENKELTIDGLFSIYGQEFSRKLRQTHAKYARASESITARYLNGEDVFDVARNIDFPACQMMRLIVERVLCVNHKLVGKILKEPHERVPNFLPNESPAFQSHNAKKLIERLKVDCERVVAWDCGASPATERSRREAGLEYEKILEDALKDIGASFETENDLRAEGSSRTPDVRLKVPISVNGRTIHWIDSKASFCDPQVHEESGLKQFRAYVNRFGSGMVIYWHGVVDELALVDPNVLLVQKFPDRSEITMWPSYNDD